MPRPNVAPRPVCRYYNTSRGCFAGDKCHYLHGDPAEQKYAPYEENKTCRYFSQGYCKRGRECWYKHVEPKAVEPSPSPSSASVSATSSAPSTSTATPSQSRQEPIEKEDLACGICFEERPSLYGLLNGCSHAFCLPCIRRWREPEGKGIDLTESGMHKTCPMCRTRSKFVVPSSIFYMQDDPRKVAVVENYKQSMSRVPCRYFVESTPENRFCPFGKDCFYQHLNEDGTPYVFTEGVDAMMRRRRRDNDLGSAWDTDPFQLVLEALEDSMLPLPTDGEGHETSETTLTIDIETNTTEPNLDGNDDESTDSNIRREVFNLHFGQMMRTMGHSCSGSGMTISSAIDIEALLAESLSSEDDEESWDEDEPFVVYTGDLGGEDADDEDEDEDDGEEESGSYWDEFLSNPPVPSIAPKSFTPLQMGEDECYDSEASSLDDPAELESESEPEESEIETEIEDTIDVSNVTATALSCFPVVDEQWDISVLADESSRFVDQRW